MKLRATTEHVTQECMRIFDDVVYNLSTNYTRLVLRDVAWFA